MQSDRRRVQGPWRGYETCRRGKLHGSLGRLSFLVRVVFRDVCGVDVTRKELRRWCRLSGVRGCGLQPGPGLVRWGSPSTKVEGIIDRRRPLLSGRGDEETPDDLCPDPVHVSFVRRGISQGRYTELRLRSPSVRQGRGNGSIRLRGSA